MKGEKEKLHDLKAEAKAYTAERIKEAKKDYERVVSRSKIYLEIVEMFPDMLYPGKFIINFFTDLKLEVPYDLKWFLEFRSIMEAGGWAIRELEYLNDPTSKERYYRCRKDSYSFDIVLDADDEDAVCQLVKIGEEKRQQTVPLYEIICPEGEVPIGEKAN